MAFGRLERQILGLVIGFAAKFVTGSLFVFNVYQDVIKDTFNYTQKEIEVMSSLLNVGLGIGFVPGAMFDRFGPQWTSAAGLVISVSAYLLLWSSTKYVAFYSSNSWLMAIYFFLCGFGSVFTYMVALNTNIINFDKKYVVIIVGMLNAFFAGSPSIFSVIYFNLFTHGDSTDTANQDFPGFMLMFAISFGVADLLCVAFMRIEKPPDAVLDPDTMASINGVAAVLSSAETISTTASDIHKPKQLHSPIENSIEKSTESPFPENTEQQPLPEIEEDINTNIYPYSNIPLSLKQLIVNLDYHIFIWHFAFVSCIGLVFVNNITVISKSLHLNQYDNRLTIIIPITNAILSAGVGLFSFFFRRSIPKIMIVNFAVVCFILSQVLVLIYADHIAVLVISTVIVGIGIGIIWSLFPTIIQEMFYIGNIGRNWGIAILVASALGFAAQEIFGALYDHQISTPGETHCYGMGCLRGGTIVLVVFGSLALCLGVVTQVRRWWLNKYVRNG